jgi:diguanylate cyclase (GGDEF)-like protein
LFSPSSADQHQPPSSLASGRYMTFLAIQLIALSLTLFLGQKMLVLNINYAGHHAGLMSDRQWIDAVEGQLDELSQAKPGSAEEEQIFAEISRNLNSLEAFVQFPPDIAAALPAETSELREAAADLERTWSASRPVTQGNKATLANSASVASAAFRLERALNAQESGVDRLDDTSFRRFEDVQKIRWLTLIFVSSAWLLTLIVFGYAAKLYQHLRKEELARFHMESELAAERAALERRVETRTAALQAEVKERQRAERMNRGRNHMLEMVARNEPIADIFSALTETVAEFQSTWTCGVHSLGSGSLRLVASSRLNEKVKLHLKSISTSFAGAPESVALASGQPHHVGDLGAVHSPWSELLRANGLVSVWSAPFYASGAAPLGTISVYTLLQWAPSQADLEMLEMALHMAALVLERSQLQMQLIDHAYHDSLTGLPNRRLARDRIAHAINRSARTNQKMAVLWIDLDRFKQINDQYGHPVGDAVLQHTARRLTARLRSSDTLARMGGDEFMALIEGTRSREETETIARGLLETLAQPMNVDELELVISASIGVSMYPEDGQTGDLLSQHADQAMYAAKFGSCGVRTFSPEMDREPAERRELEAELNHALANEGFTVAYQPLCMPDGLLHGFEALLRFYSPRLGNVPPSEFIPIAEESQLIIPLGEWVLREVCRQGNEWQDAGYPAASIAVNISALQFARDDFAETVAQILEETGYPAEQLVLELTESIVMNDFTESARQMKRLKRLGVRFAIDDFGTGYSSLSYLHRLPIDVLKIDRSFMETLNEADGTGPIVEAVLSMAHTLGLQVVAEGVETAEQLETLRLDGCDVIQGYFFSRPVPSETAAGFLQFGRLVGKERPFFTDAKPGCPEQDTVSRA